MPAEKRAHFRHVGEFKATVGILMELHGAPLDMYLAHARDEIPKPAADYSNGWQPPPFGEAYVRVCVCAVGASSASAHVRWCVGRAYRCVIIDAFMAPRTAQPTSRTY